MEPDTLRSLERILAVMVGGFTVYLGYRLFLQIPNRTDSQGKVILPGGISIYMTRIGPGCFFALFGAIVLGLSFKNAVTYSKGLPGDSTNAHRSTEYSGIVGATITPSLSAKTRPELQLT